MNSKIDISYREDSTEKILVSEGDIVLINTKTNNAISEFIAKVVVDCDKDNNKKTVKFAVIDDVVSFTVIFDMDTLLELDKKYYTIVGTQLVIVGVCDITVSVNNVRR